MSAAAYWLQRGLVMGLLSADWSRLALAVLNRLLVLRPKDAALGKAIMEARGSKRVSRKSIDKILKGQK